MSNSVKSNMVASVEGGKEKDGDITIRLISICPTLWLLIMMFCWFQADIAVMKN